MKTATVSRFRARGRAFAARVEPLEVRALLNATIDVDAAGRLSVQTDPAARSSLKVSEVSGVYTVAVGAADAPIVVVGNAAGLTITGGGARSVLVAGPSAVQINVLADSDSVLLASSNVPTTIAVWASGATVTLGDAADPNGLGGLPAPVVVGGSPTASNNRLVLDDGGWNSQTSGPSDHDWPPFHDQPYFRLASGSVASRQGVGLVSYSGLSALTLRGAAALGPFASADVVVDGTADGVDTRIDLSLGVNPQNVSVKGTSAAAGSRLTIVGGRQQTSVDLISSSSPVTLQSTPGSSGATLYVDASRMTAATDVAFLGAGGGDGLKIEAGGLPITTADFHADPGATTFSPPAPHGGVVRFSNVPIVDVYDVAAAPTVVTSNPLNVAAGQTLSDVVVATITTALPNPTVYDFSPTILWGDSPTASGGYVVADPDDPTRFFVVGSNRFAEAGSFTPGVILQTQGRTATVVVNGASVQFRYWSGYHFSADALALSGGLQRGDRDGGVTNDDEPFMIGQISAAQGSARIVAYATPDGGGAAIVIGRSVSGPFGQWQLQPDVPLPDGRYTIQVQAFDDARGLTSRLTTLATGLNVDTVGPQVAGVRFLPGQGRIVVAYRDSGGAGNAGTGIDFLTAIDPSAYEFSGGTVTSIVASPPFRSAPLRVNLIINDGRPIRRGNYLLTAGAVRDGAGNPLQGGFDGRFPTRGPGDFQARFGVLHGRALRPLPVRTAAVGRLLASKSGGSMRR